MAAHVLTPCCTYINVPTIKMPRHASTTLTAAALDAAAATSTCSSNIRPALSGSSFRKSWDVSAVACEILLDHVRTRLVTSGSKISIPNHHHHRRQLGETQTRCLPKREISSENLFSPASETRSKPKRKNSNKTEPAIFPQFQHYNAQTKTM